MIDSNDSDEHQAALLEALRAATLGEYDVYSELGRGGMATVFLALELSLNRSVAIKVMSPSALNHKTLVERFWHEARTAASLSHPHVIPIYAVRSAAGLHFFVMKHVDGGSLDSVLRTQGELPLPLVTTILTHVSSALAYAHRHGVIHRDVKPANIMLDKEGFAIVMDFGIAKVRDMSLTTPGIMVGTPLYMSPEQISGGILDGRSDQYSLGVVAFELLTGKRPFSGETMPEILRGHFVDKPPDIRELRPDCPAALALAVNRMLCKEQADRYPSLDSVLSVLGELSRSNGDDVREKIISLARSISISQPRISQPASPLPITRNEKRPPGSQQSKTDAVARFGFAMKRRPFMTSAVALAVLATVATLITSSNRSRTEPPSPTLVTRPAVSNSHAAPSIPSPTPAKDDHAVPPGTQNGSAQALSSGKAKAPEASAKPPGKKSPAETRISARDRSVDQQSGVPRPRPTPPAGAIEKLPSTDAGSLRIAAPGFVGPGLVAPGPPPPPAPSATPEPAVIRIGSRIPEAVLYVDGSFISLISSLRTITHKPGQVRLQIKAEDCVAWDSVFYVGPADTAQIGFRNPKCVR